MTRQARAVFVGCGARAGSTYQDFCDAGGKIVGMFDPSDAPLTRFGAPSDTPRFNNLDKMLQSVDADVAFIASPNFVHAEQYIACADAGLHTWVEKPIAITLDEAEAMRAAEQRNGIKTAIPFATNEDAIERDAVDMFRRGDLGPFVQMTVVRMCGVRFHVAGGRHYAIEKPEVSGGWIAHHLCHMIDFAMQIAGPVEYGYCQTDTTIENPKPHQEEAITSVLRFANGGTATLCDNPCGHQQTQTVISGHRGVWISHEDKTRVRTSTDDILCRIDRTIDGKHELKKWTLSEFRAYEVSKPSYVKQFLDAALSGGPWDTTIDRGINVMRVYLALQEAAATNQPVAVAVDALSDVVAGQLVARKRGYFWM